MRAARLFDQRSEDLQVERYAESVCRHLLAVSPTSAPQLEQETLLQAAEVERLYDVLQAVQDAAASLSDTWLDAYQERCTWLLAAGVRHGFVRRRRWLRLLQLAAGLRLPLPQLAGAVAWALTHETAPFGEGPGLKQAVAAWLQLLEVSGLHKAAQSSAWSTSAKDGRDKRAGAAAGKGSRERPAPVLPVAGGPPALLSSLLALGAGGSAEGRVVELPGVGWLDMSLLSGCLAQGKRVLNTQVPSPAEWVSMLRLRLGSKSTAAAAATDGRA